MLKCTLLALYIFLGYNELAASLKGGVFVALAIK
jgi:hypothetical protein